MDFSQKQKLNAVLEKENTHWTIRVKNRMFLANEKRVNLLQKKFVGVQLFISVNKTKQNWKLKTLQEKHIVHEAIKI
jgi:hypothetical protein